MILAGPFGEALTMPIRWLPMLAGLMAAGAWARRLGGRVEWLGVPVLAASILAAALLTDLSVRIPHVSLLAASGTLAAGLLAATTPRAPDWLAIAGLAAVGFCLGYGPASPAGAGLPIWAGAVAGAFLVAAGGTGTAAVLSQAVSWRAVHGLGAVVALYGGYLVFATI